ncbi:MAG: alpha/beta fold hydrolase [Gemmatimonadaceae bacterium]
MRQELEIAAPGGRTVRGDLYAAEGAKTGVVLCHGFKGFARWGPWPTLAEAVNERGLNAIAFDFSGSGVGKDRENFTEIEAFAGNTYARELEDLGAVVDHATEHGWIAREFGLFGHSRGGATAIFFAADSDRVASLVTWASIATIERWSEEQLRDWRERGYTEVVNSRTGQVLRIDKSAWEECERESRARLNVERAAARVRARWLIVHGSADDVVPVSDAHRLGRANARAEVRVIEGANHGLGAAHPLVTIPEELRMAMAGTADFYPATLPG